MQTFPPETLAVRAEGSRPLDEETLCVGGEPVTLMDEAELRAALVTVSNAANEYVTLYREALARERETRRRTRLAHMGLCGAFGVLAGAGSVEVVLPGTHWLALALMGTAGVVSALLADRAFEGVTCYDEEGD